MERNFLPLSDIFIPQENEGRIREKGNLAELTTARARSILRFGQLQPILVEELDEPVGGRHWKLVDGQVRWLSMMSLTVRHSNGEDEIIEAFERHGLQPGQIEVTTRETQEPEQALMMEFHANEDREGFTWDEKGRYVRRIHDMLKAKHGKEWTGKKTAEYIGQSEMTVSNYLALTDEQDPATQSPKVKSAKSLRSAQKQLKIEKNRRQRRARVESQEKRAKEQKAAGVDVAEIAKLVCYHGDCREWIAKIPDDSLAWFHWDPPYGGKEGTGGAFAGHEAIETDHQYFMELALAMIPEIHRVLHDGSWLAIWFTPVHYNWLRLALQGHRFNKAGKCLFCDRHIWKDHDWLSSNYTCRPSPHRFWVNPYPNYWRKTNRKADGHEIQRFFTKETEPFLLAGKHVDQTPILLRSDRGNVFDFPALEQHSETRRHVHHKPPALLEEILTCISVSGSIGGDAGAGSGSILEAAFRTGRKAVVAELREDHWVDCMAVTVQALVGKNINTEYIASWLKEAFAG